MEFFRAVPINGFNPNERQRWKADRRMPSNIPFFIDNLWELFRPDDMPSRRHSVYASPTPALALENASAGHLQKDQYIACYVRFDYPARFVQLNVTDARYHPDVKALQGLVRKHLGRKWGNFSLIEKSGLAALFLPVISAEELREAATRSSTLSDIIMEAEKLVSIWQPGSKSSLDGELFFELQDDNSYILEPITTTALPKHNSEDSY